MQAVNVGRYPLHDLESPEGKKLVEHTRNEIKMNGVAALPDFLLPSAIEHIINDAEAVTNAFRSNNDHNIYLDDSEGETEEEIRIRKLQQQSSKACVTNDQIPPSCPIALVYNWQPLTDFIARVLEKEYLYQTADVLGALNIHLYSENDQLGWHFDRGEFAITVLIQAPEEGGHFEFFPNIRSQEEPNFERVLQALSSEGEEKTIEPVRFPMTPGMMLIFCGRNSLHRVSPVTGNRKRILAVLSYETKPGVVLNEYTRLKFFGRLN